MSPKVLLNIVMFSSLPNTPSKLHIFLQHIIRRKLYKYVLRTVSSYLHNLSKYNGKIKNKSSFFPKMTHRLSSGEFGCNCKSSFHAFFGLPTNRFSPPGKPVIDFISNQYLFFFVPFCVANISW